MVMTLRFAWGGDYAHVLAGARNLLRDLFAVDPSQSTVFSLIDAMSDIHGAIHRVFTSLHPDPFRLIEPERLITDNGLVLRVYPAAR